MKQDGERGARSQIRLLHGRFEAQFDDVDTARAAARDTRAVGFVTDVEQDTTGWLIVGRRKLPFPGDERDRYASRFEGIAARHGGTLRRFVEERPEPSATQVVETLRGETDADAE